VRPDSNETLPLESQKRKIDVEEKSIILVGRGR